MKRLFTSFLAFCLLCGWVNAQNIFVSSTAAGLNNGTSWANAYSNLQTALTAAVPGTKVWVKAGTYKPSAVNISFTVVAGVELYGGFAGTETLLSQRNIDANPTILSGDFNGDDSPTDLTLNRADNAWHVIQVTAGVATNRSVIDGFIISNGNTKVATADPDLTKRGGGVLATAKVTVRNCTFKENQGLSGGAIAALDAAGSGLIVDNCIFENNLSTSQAAGIFLRSCTAGSINRCIFRNNNTNRGTVYPNLSSNIEIDSCLFENNKAGTDRWGAGFYNWQSSYTMTNCVFKDNVAHNAGGIYNDNRDGGDFFTIDNCWFENNSSTSYGGSAIFNNIAAFEIKNCTFKNNSAPTSAAAIYIGGNNGPAATIKDCLFEGGTTAFGAAISNYAGFQPVTIQGCLFKSNAAVTSGGAVTNGFKAKTTLIDCVFDANQARFGGGVFAQNDSTDVTLINCTFSGNNADDVGGGAYFSSGNITNISNCLFTLNSSDNGAALVISEDSLDLSVSTIDRCIFQENFALNQAGGLNVENATVTVTNSLFAGNQVLGTGAGAGALVNGFDGKTAILNLMNCTFGANIGPLGAGLAGFENVDDAGETVINVQNSIFANDGDNFAIEAGTPTVNSTGGNISSDATLASSFTGTNDLNNTDPNLVNPTNFDFHLQLSSPCINKGIAAGAPNTDITGAIRINAPDMGAYESNAVGVLNPAENRVPLSLMPNPATAVTRSLIDNDFRGQLAVSVIDPAGKVVRSLYFEKTADQFQMELPVQDLPKGAYLVRVQAGNTLMSGGFIKM